MMGHPMDGEMQEGMHGQMMAGPMHRQMMRRHVRGAIRRRMIMRRHLRRGGMGFGRGPMGMQQGMGRGMGRGMGMGMGAGRGPAPLGRIVNNPAMRERLGITAEQAAKITQQENDFQKAGIQNRATLEIKHMELEQLMSGEKPDRAAIDKKLAEISAAQLTEQQANVHHQLDMKAALTPEQQMKLHQWMESQQPGMSPEGPQGMGRGGRGPGRPQPPPPPARQPGGEPGSPGSTVN
jgi:Spy/CpxP family protein refolding chaperone